MPSDTDMARDLISYARKVLDATSLTDGPSHMEVSFIVNV